MLENRYDGLEYRKKKTSDIVEEYRKYPVLWHSSDKN
jgi:hypothetical protein